MGTQGRAAPPRAGAACPGLGLREDMGRRARAREAKVVLLGDVSVGKTAIVQRFLQGTFDESTKGTVGASFASKTISIEDLAVKLAIWDTAGAEQYQQMAPLYYRNANAAILAFDITNKDSFGKVRYWIDELKANGPEDCMVVICGNKSDREIERGVTTEEAQTLAQSMGYAYFETSAKFDQGINSMFDYVANNLPPEAPA